MGRPFVKGEGMAYVLPNGTIQIGTINGLDNRYMHTIYFANESAQNTFMSGKLTKTFNKTSYLRMGAGAIKIQTPYYNVYKCNYMRFKNEDSSDSINTAITRENKWYYAFITDVEYVNEKTTIIYYQIDEMQTWFIGATVNPCMVLREHANTDVAGDNLESEPCGSNSYEYVHVISDNHITAGYSLIINTTAYDEQAWDASGNLVTNEKISGFTQGLANGTFLGCIPIPGFTTQAAAEQWATGVMNGLWDRMKGNWNNGDNPIQMLHTFMFPTDYAHQITDSSTWMGYKVGFQPQHFEITFDKPTRYDVKFTPENNKMFTYPFSFVTMTNRNGSAVDLRWEYFTNDQHEATTHCKIDSYGCCVNGGEIIYVPANYDGQAQNYDVKMAINDFPMCAFSYDAYQAWIAAGGDTKAKTARNYAIAGSIMNFVGSAVGVGNSLNADYNKNWQEQYDYKYRDSTYGKKLNLGAIKASEVGATNFANATAGVSNAALAVAGIQMGLKAVDTGISISSAITKCNYTFRDAEYQPRTVVGDTACSIMTATKANAMIVYHAHIRDTEARRVDEFLTAFGYATNRFKTPNFTGRQYWNFVQTKLASISGDMPATSMNAICEILDGGITFWHGDYIGNYKVGYNSATDKQVITNPIV